VSKKYGNIYSKHFERGTLSYEACAGVQGIHEYFCDIGTMLRSNNIKDTYKHIQHHEMKLHERLQSQLSDIECVSFMRSGRQSILGTVPLTTFWVDNTPSEIIVKELEKANILARSGYFLCSEKLKTEQKPDGFVRVSLAHYNSEKEVDNFVVKLRTILLSKVLSSVNDRSLH